MSRPSRCETAWHYVMMDFRPVLDPNLINEFPEFERQSSSFFPNFLKNAARNGTASWPFSARDSEEDLVGEAID